MAVIQIPNLPVAISLTGNEQVEIVQTGVSVRTTTGAIAAIYPNQTPASASAPGVIGQTCWDDNYIYVCVATNTWKRAAISTW